MTSTDANLWIDLFERATQHPPAEMNEEWKWLLEQLDLQPIYFLAVLEALKQGRWRKAKNPRAYVKTVSKREALRMGLLSDGPALITASAHALDAIAHRHSVAEPIKDDDGIWRPGSGRNRDYDDPRSEFGTYRDFLLSNVPNPLKTSIPPSKSLQREVDRINNQVEGWHIHLKPSVRLDWKKWGKLAGLTRLEQVVLKYRCQGISRENALADQKDERARRALQAAWKKFDRTGKSRLRDAAKKSLPNNVPEW